MCLGNPIENVIKLQEYDWIGIQGFVPYYARASVIRHQKARAH